jgi:hypothetical protein
MRRRDPEWLRLPSGFPAATIHDWEQNRRKPEGAARVLLKVIEEEPQAPLSRWRGAESHCIEAFPNTR